MALQTFSEVVGISICLTPNSDKASTIAFTTTPNAGVVHPRLQALFHRDEMLRVFRL